MKPLHLHVSLGSCNHMAMNGSRMTVMLFAAYLGASPAVVGLLAAMYGVVSAFTAVRVGRWIDRVGPKPPMMLASFMVGVGALIAALGHEIWALFIAAPIMGTFNSMFQMTNHQTVGRYGRAEDRAANFATHALAISIATFAGPLIAGVAIDHLGHANAFYVMAFLGFLPLFVVASGALRFPPKPEIRREEVTPVSGWALLKDKELRRAYIAAAGNNAIWSIWGFMLPLYGHSIGLSATAIGTIASFLAGGTIAVRVGTKLLLRRYSAWQLIISSHIMIGTGFLLFPFTSIYWLLTVFALVIGLGLGLAGPLSTSVMYDASPPDKVGEVIGLRMTMANIAQVLVPVGGGVVGAALGVGPVFWAVAACLLGEAWTDREKLRRRKAG